MTFELDQTKIDAMSESEVENELEMLAEESKRISEIRRELVNRKILLTAQCFVAVVRLDAFSGNFIDPWRIYGAVPHEETRAEKFSLRSKNPGEVRISFYSGMTKFEFTLERSNFHFKECPDMQEFDGPDAPSLEYEWTFELFETLVSAQDFIVRKTAHSPASR